MSVRRDLGRDSTRVQLMKILAVLIVGACVALTGCASSNPNLTEADYVRLVHANVPELASFSPSRLEQAARTICDLLTTRGSPTVTNWMIAVKTLTDAGLSASDAGAMIVYAAGRDCPSMVPVLKNF